MGFSGYYYADFEYTIDATGHITLTHGKYADEEDKWPGLPVLRYEDGKIDALQRQHQPYLVVGNMGWTEVLDGRRAVSSAYALDDGGYGTLVVGRHQVVK